MSSELIAPRLALNSLRRFTCSVGLPTVVYSSFRLYPFEVVMFYSLFDPKHISWTNGLYLYSALLVLMPTPTHKSVFSHSYTSGKGYHLRCHLLIGSHNHSYESTYQWKSHESKPLNHWPSNWQMTAQYNRYMVVIYFKSIFFWSSYSWPCFLFVKISTIWNLHFLAFVHKTEDQVNSLYIRLMPTLIKTLSWVKKKSFT